MTNSERKKDARKQVQEIVRCALECIDFRVQCNGHEFRVARQQLSVTPSPFWIENLAYLDKMIASYWTHHKSRFSTYEEAVAAIEPLRDCLASYKPLSHFWVDCLG